MSHNPNVTQQKNKRQWLTTYLRQRIVQGELTPGEQLPTRGEMEREFGLSTVTVQQALNSLISDEFVTVNGRRGTFVSSNPPHLTRYAIVLPQHPHDSARWTGFMAALCDEAARLQRAGEHRIFVHVGVEAHADNEAFQLLVREVREHRLAGLIFLSQNDYAGTPLESEPGIARVLLGAGVPELPTMHAVSLDLDSLWQGALGYCAARGRRRLAVLRSEPGDAEGIRAEAAAHGLEVRPYWVQTVSVASAQAARQCVHLLMHAGQQERPDALFITDDNLVEAATLGLIDAGVQVPGDVEVVAHGNFPHLTPSRLPVMRLGFDIRRALQLCIEDIDRQRQGDQAEALTKVSARFEGEEASILA